VADLKASSKESNPERATNREYHGVQT